MLACGCFYFEPVGHPSNDDDGDPSEPPCALPEDLPDTCTGAAAVDAAELDGLWAGSFCLDTRALWGSVPLHDVCSGEASVAIDHLASPAIVGDGACAFEGGGLRAIRPWMPGSYPGEVEGAWVDVGAAEGIVAVETDAGPMTGDWTAEACSGSMIGEIAGTTELDWDGDVLELRWRGWFVVVPAQ